jgi:autotransporter passenger strand-loop-strand repeat protein
LTVAPDTYIQGTSAGSAFLVKNAFISDYTVKFGSWISVSSGTANYTNVNGGSMSIRSGGTANHTTVNFGGRLGIASGGCRARRSPAGLDSATRKTSSDSS